MSRERRLVDEQLQEESAEVGEESVPVVRRQPRGVRPMTWWCTQERAHQQG
jgi:hypothetical protein